MKKSGAAAVAVACLAVLLAACTTETTGTTGRVADPGQTGASATPVPAPSGAAAPAAATPRPATATSAMRSQDSVDRPAGFWYGSDSWPVPVTGGGPYGNAAIGGGYGGYIGMAGNWARWLNCGTGNFLAWSGANSRQATANYTRYGKGIGTGVYWYMGGPGVDPGYNSTSGEAYSWGARQAVQAIAAANRDQVTYRIVFMDIEMPGIAPAPDNGWTAVYTTPCSGTRTGRSVTPSLARAEFNGFADYLKAHSGYLPGVYSEPGTWAQVFGSLGSIPHTYEWTYTPETANLAEAPSGWCLRGTSQCAEFFGGVTRSSPYAVMWQWSGGGGIRNPIGDFDQISMASVR